MMLARAAVADQRRFSWPARAALIGPMPAWCGGFRRACGRHGYRFEVVRAETFVRDERSCYPPAAVGTALLMAIQLSSSVPIYLMARLLMPTWPRAVAIGVAVDTVYSSLVHGLPTHDAERVLLVLERLGLLCDHSTLRRTDELFSGLEEFRQHLGGQLTITMLDAIGHPINVHHINRDRMAEAIQIVVDRVQARSH